MVGVSSFGYSGTIAHAVLEAAPPSLSPSSPPPLAYARRRDRRLLLVVTPIGFDMLQEQDSNPRPLRYWDKAHLLYA